MTFEVNEFQVGQPITFNFEELKTELTEKVQHYKTLVYTDDQVSDAKKDRANLNKLKDAIEGRRKEIKKQCLAPYEDFEKQVKQIVSIIDEPIGLIDKQVKEFEAEKKDAKKKEIEELWDATSKPEWLSLEKIWDEKWLNASVTIKQVETAIQDRLTQIDSEMGIIQSLPYAAEAEVLYRESLNLSLANQESARIAEIQKAVEAKKVVEEAPTQDTISEDEPKIVVKFQCEITLTQATMLKQFCEEHGIVLKQV